MLFAKTANFYRTASDQQIEEFETALDNDNTALATSLVENFQPIETTTVEAKIKAPDYLDLPPEVGDMVIQVSTGHMVRLIAISDDKELALVKEEWGAHPAQYADLRRVR